jgi:hypothetical protein
MNPIVGYRVGSPRSPDLRDMDLIAGLDLSSAYPVPGGEPGAAALFQVRMVAMIQAKAMPPGMAFVGYPWRQPTVQHGRGARSFVGGCPSARVLRGYDFAWPVVSDRVEESVIAALDPLNQGATVCHQWSVVHRRGGSRSEAENKAEHLRDYADDIANVVEATEWMLLDDTNDQAGDAHMSFIYPTLVVGTKALYLYDVHTKELQRTDRIIYEGTFDLGTGKPATRYVDVITEEAVPPMIARYKRTFGEVVSRLTSRTDAIHAAARAQRSQRQAEAFRARVAERHDQGLPIGAG